MDKVKHRTQWSSFSSYILVTTGAIVGLGNVLKFPFLVTQYGGLFLLFYILCQLFVALPLLFAELLIGRRGKQNPVGAIGILTIETDANPNWRKLGWFCVLIAFLTMGYYTVSAGFPVGYFIDNIKDILHHETSLGSHVKLENNALSTFSQLEICFAIFLLLAIFVVYRGINRGLEQLSSITVPLYFIILLALMVYISIQGYFEESIHHLFKVQAHIPVDEIFLAALGLAFLKYNTGMGVMIVYGSYLPSHVTLSKSTCLIILIDAIISLMAYFIIFPLALATNPDSHFIALSNHTVISIFGGIQHSLIISALFFFAAILIAFTPVVAMAETVVVTLMERLNWSRPFAATITMLSIFIVGTFVVATHTIWIDVKIFDFLNLHNLLKNFTSDILTPIAGILLAIFAGWILTRHITESELKFKPFSYMLWRYLIRYVAPIGVGIVLITVTVLEKLTY